MQVPGAVAVAQWRSVEVSLVLEGVVAGTVGTYGR